MFKIPDSLQVRKNQLWLATGLLSVLVLIALLFVYLFDGSSSTKDQTSASQAPKAIEIESSGKRVNAEEMWRYKIEDDQKKVVDQLQGIQKLLQEAITAKPTQQSQDQIQVLEDKIVGLEQKLKDESLRDESLRNESLKDQTQTFPPLDLPPLEPSQGRERSMGGSAPNSSLIQKITLNLGKNPKENQKKDPIKTVDNTIPAGAFAKAVL